MNLITQISDFTWINILYYIDLFNKWLSIYSPKIIGFILFLIIGFKISNISEKYILKLMAIQTMSPMIKSFTASLSTILLKIIVIIISLSILWVQTSSLVALLAAAWFAIGMALSGTLQNFAWGIMILIFKPFKVNHYVEIWWKTWLIKEVSIFNTTILTPDQKRIIIPNSDISNWLIINYSAEPKRRVDFVIWISYKDNIDKVREILLEIANADERILKDDDITVWLVGLWDNSVNFDYKFFVNTPDYLKTKYDILETVKKAFDKNKISIPFPQRDIHLYNEKV